jgi:hypothetical protein
MSNPFTEISSALRGYGEAHFTALPDGHKAKVRVGNRGGVIFRKGQQFADNPAWYIRRVELRDVSPLKTSSSGTFVVVYEIGYRSDETKQGDDTESLDAVEWELVRVATKACVEKLGLSYVLRVAVEAARQTVAATEMTKEGQWSGAATLLIEFTKPRTEILPS